MALINIEAVYHICPNMHPREFSIAKEVISACNKVGCRRIVYHSVLHPQAKKMVHHLQKLRVEELLFESKLIYTILQPTAYMQNITGYWDEILAGKYAIPYPVETKISLLDLDDLAEAAKNILAESNHDYATYELVGTEPLSQTEIALALSEYLGYKVTAERIPLDIWKINAESSGLSKYGISTLVSMFEYYRDFGLCGNQNALSHLIKRSPTTLSEYLSRLSKNN